MIINNPFAKNDGTDPEWLERFVAKINIKGEDECWEWQGARQGRCATNGGYAYGSFLLRKGKNIAAHRLAYILKFGEPTPDKPLVRHTCDNTVCCNFNHLISGTNHDNMADKMSRGRGGHLKGDAHPNSKIKESDIVEILKLYWEEGVTTPKIAKLYGVSAATIQHVINRKKQANSCIPEPEKKVYHRRMFKQRIESLAPQVLGALQDGQVHSGRVLAIELDISAKHLWNTLTYLKEKGSNIQSSGGRGYRLAK